MGVNWTAGLIRWKPHVDGAGKVYPLNHLHPFRMAVHLPQLPKRQEQDLRLYVGFDLHTFTHKTLANDDPADDYADDLETRTFDRERYGLSFHLPKILRELQQRLCYFTLDYLTRQNYVTVDISASASYAVFFDLLRRPENPGDTVTLLAQSAYPLVPPKRWPGKGKISFAALLGHAIRGTKPKQPS